MRTSTEISNELSAAGFERMIVVDNDYMLPSELYVEEFGSRFIDLLFRSGLRYDLDTFDCDDFAVMAAMLMRLDHAKHNKDSMCSIACGFSHITTSTGSSHMCVCAVLKINGVLSVKLYEPQQQGNICLKEIPISGCQLHFCYM